MTTGALGCRRRGGFFRGGPFSARCRRDTHAANGCVAVNVAGPWALNEDVAVQDQRSAAVRTLCLSAQRLGLLRSLGPPLALRVRHKWGQRRRTGGAGEGLCWRVALS